jgi:transposase-like protein
MTDRKQYSDEFKRDAIRLQETSGKEVKLAKLVSLNNPPFSETLK